MDATLLDLYEQAEPSRKGYVARLLSLWERRFPELRAMGPLSARLSRLRKLKVSPPETSRECHHTPEASQEGTTTSVCSNPVQRGRAHAKWA